jgi:serine/threonine protein kinase
MDKEFLQDYRDFLEKIEKYKRPEDFFGELNGTVDEMISKTKAISGPLWMKYHTDRVSLSGNQEVIDLAHDIMCALNGLMSKAEKKIRDGTYGKLDEPVKSEPLFDIKTRTRTYRIMKDIGAGDLCRLYAAEYDSDKGIAAACIKICGNPADNDTLIKEINFLKSVTHKQIPAFIESFITTNRQQAVIMQMVNGFDVVSLREMPMYAKGIPLKHACWIMERSLRVLGHIHSNELTIHGDVTPWHLVVRPFDHRVFLVDYTYSTQGGGNYCLPATEIYSAPEISKSAEASPEADIFALGKTMIYLLGGDPETNRVPKSVDRRIIDLLGDMINQDPKRRNGNAWGLARRLSDLRLEIFRDRHGFIPFATE